MPHIHTEPGQHDATASAYILRSDVVDENGKPKLMLHRHKKLGQLMQYGGHVELCQTPWQAILNEIKEESGYEPDQLTILQPPHMLTHLSDTAQLHPYPVCLNTHDFDGTGNHYHSDIGYAFMSSEPPRLELEEGESQDTVLVSLAELRALPDGEIISNVREICEFIMTVCVETWEQHQLNEWKA